MALENVKPSWMIAAVALIAAGAGFAHWKAIDSRRADLAAVEADVRAAEQGNAVQATATAQLPKLRRDVETFAKSIPPNTDLGRLMETIGEALNSDGVAEREVVTRPTIAGQPVARIPFSLQYRGTFAGTMALLRRMQEGHRLTRVDRVVIDGTGAADGETPLHVQIEFSTFSRTSQELESWATAAE